MQQTDYNYDKSLLIVSNKITRDHNPVAWRGRTRRGGCRLPAAGPAAGLRRPKAAPREWRERIKIFNKAQ